MAKSFVERRFGRHVAARRRKEGGGDFRLKIKLILSGGNEAGRLDRDPDVLNHARTFDVGERDRFAGLHGDARANFPALAEFGGVRGAVLVLAQIGAGPAGASAVRVLSAD